MNRNKYLLIGCFFVLLNTGVIFYQVQANSGKKAINLEKQNQENRKKIITAGVPVQRKRIDNFIKQTFTYKNFSELEKGLNDPLIDFDNDPNNDSDLLTDVAFGGSDFNPEMQFAVCLADRRVAKLYSLLEKMPKDEASKKASDLFNSKFDIFKKGWLETVESSKLIKSMQTAVEDTKDYKRKASSDDKNYRALSNALFLCASFCDKMILLNNIDEWEQFGNHLLTEYDKFKKPQISHALKPFVRTTGLPQRLYLFNIYLFYMERNQLLNREEVHAKLRNDFPMPRFYKTSFCTWDAYTNPFDSTLQHEFVPIENEVIFHTTLFTSWNVPSEEKSKLLLEVRSLISDIPIIFYHY